MALFTSLHHSLALGTWQSARAKAFRFIQFCSNQPLLLVDMYFDYYMTHSGVGGLDPLCFPDP